MAKTILRLFGALSLIAGALVLLIGAAIGPTTFLAISFPIGAGALVSGSLLLGFAHGLTLLERIERNTRSVGTGLPVSPEEARVDPAVLKYMRERGSQ